MAFSPAQLAALRASVAHQGDATATGGSVEADALRRIAEGKRRLAELSSCDGVLLDVLPAVHPALPRYSAPGVASSLGLNDGAQNAANEQEDAENTGQTQFMTKEELNRMRAEIREAGRQRLRDQAKKRSDMDAVCPLFLSLRMRRMLEYSLGLQPSDVDTESGTFDCAALEDGVAKTVADLTFHHSFPPSCVHYFLEDIPELQAPTKASLHAQQLYRRVLTKMSENLKGDQLSGVNWAALPDGRLHPLVPAVLDAQRAQRTYGVEGLNNEDVVMQKKGQDRGPPRTWFGIDNEDLDKDTYVYRKVVKNDLPIAQHKKEIIDTIRDNQITLIQGETGCGKTTQVPQYILEAACVAQREQRRAVRVVVTQPRRIAAITVAKRVAEELGEKVGEGVVGYKIRGTTVAGPKCKLLFCTTGVILRRLANEGSKWMFSPKTVTHLLVDEVHERGVDTDFMLTFLREVQAQRPNLRVVLMSATMDTECFRKFFTLSSTTKEANAEAVVTTFEPPTIKCPAFCHPVVEVYLEGMCKRLGREGPADAKSPDQLRQEADGGDGIDYDLILAAIEEIEKSPDGAWTFDTGPARARPADPTKGAILIFLPGLGEITQMMTTLQEHSALSSKWWVLPLHANLPPEDQQTCFQTALPAGCTRKIICATNVAETSVTVPDVTVVIDTCRERRNQVDKFSNTPTLREQWCAKDSLKQRRGRAGRVQPGVCFRLLPAAHWERLDDITPPEMQRVPLENVYLQVCASGIHNRPAFLAKTPDPPEDSAVLFAELALKELGALDPTEHDGMSPLGRHLAALPCHPRLGKILVLGCLLGVPGPCLSICAAMSGRNPMLTTQDKTKRVAWQSARVELVNQITTCSDHCCWAYIMQEWRFGDIKQRELCRKLGLAFERMCAAMFERKHLCESLVQVGMLPKSFLYNEWYDQDKMPDWTLVRAAVVGGLYPNIIHVEKSMPRYQSNAVGDKAKWLRYTMLQKQYAKYQSMSFPKSVNVHPNSLCFGKDHFHCPYLAYYCIQHTTKLYAYDLTEVNPFALLLFGTEPVYNKAASEFEVGGWAHFKCPNGDQILPVIQAARVAWLGVLERKLDDVKFDIQSSTELAACIQLLKTGGLGFRPPSPPPIERERGKGFKQDDEFNEWENETAFMLKKDKASEDFSKAAWAAAKRVAEGGKT